MKKKQWMAFLLAGTMTAMAGSNSCMPVLAAENETASASADGISITDSESIIEIICDDPIVVLDDDLALITINGVKLDKEDGRLWYYYSIKNKSEDTYIRTFFGSESFGDSMTDYSSYSQFGSSSAVPGGKWSGLRGSGTENIGSIQTLDDLKRFSATITLYPSDSPDSYSSDGSYSASFDIDFDALDGLIRLSDTGEVLVPPAGSLPDDFQPDGATLTTTEEYAELTFDEPYVILDNDMAEVAITSLKLVYNDKIWYYYTVKNKTSDKYIREFFDTEAFNDVMVDYSVKSTEGPSDSIPAGKSSGIKGSGSGDISNISGPSDLLNFSGSIRIYPSDEPNSYGSEDPSSGSFSIQLAGNAMATTDDAADTTEEVTTEAAATDNGSDSSIATAEEVDTLLQGMWTLQDTNIFTFEGGSFTASQNGETVMSGTYSVDTDTKEIKLAIASSDGKTVNAGLPYSVENQVLTIYNDAGIAMVKQDGATTETASATETTDSSSAVSAEELEAQLAQQPMTVLNTEVTNGYDDRIDLSFSTAIAIPHILNQSGSDIKYLEIQMAGWDENNLPVKLQSAYMSYSASENIIITFDGINMVDGMELNTDDADYFYLIAVDDSCRLAKAKCIVTKYTTYDGDTWENPLFSTWKETYVGKKLVEPVVYTDQETIQNVQAALNNAGYECGTPDGVAGAKTYEALNAYQKANGLPVSNDITDSLLEKLNLQ